MTVAMAAAYHACLRVGEFTAAYKRDTAPRLRAVGFTLADTPPSATLFLRGIKTSLGRPVRVAACPTVWLAR